MFDSFVSLVAQHDRQWTVLALAIGLLTAAVGTVASRRIGRAGGKGAVLWCVLTGVTFGFGIWATHFIAMIGWHPGFALGYDLVGTILSLLFGCAVTTLALWCARQRAALGGALLGVGVAGMHLAGMAALEYGGPAAWDMGRLTVALVGGTVLTALSLGIGMSRRSLRSGVVAGLLMAGGICGLHYGSMAAVDMSACFAAGGIAGVSESVIGAAAALAALLVLGAPMLGLYLDARDQRNALLEDQRLRELANISFEGLLTCADGRILTCNAAFRILTGLDAGAELGRVLSPAALEVLRASAALPQEVDILDHAGEAIPAQATLRPIAFGKGSVEAIAIRDLRAQWADQEARHQAAQERLEAERRFRFLIQSVTDYAIYMLSPDGHIANWNAGAERNKGYTEAEIIGRHFSIFFSDEDRARGLPQAMLEEATRVGRVEAEGWRYRKDGTSFWASVSLVPIHDDTGRHIGFAKVTHDNTRRRADAEAIRIIQHKLKLALENMSQGIALFDEAECLVLCNARLTDIVGFASVPQMPLDDFAAALAGMVDLASDSLEDLCARHRDVWHGRAGGEMLLDFADGRTIMVVHRPVPGGGWVSTFEDVSERTRSERQIVHMARHDALTGLPNRASFAEHIEWVLDAARENPDLRVAVLGIDLDRFKEINDHMGHAIGDQVLAGLARRMSSVLQGDEFIARFGGDEFAAYKTCRSTAEMEEFQHRLMTILCATLDIGGTELSVGASMGLAVFPEDAGDYEKLIANADLAMYRAKASLSEKMCRYEPAMDEASRDRQSLARDLWRAVERGELYLHHQIQKSVSTGKTTGYEVLLRWTHPERGPISPADFIPLAEECGAILPIGDWVLRTACRQAAAWSQKVRIAVNLSPVQLSNARFVPQLKAILAETGLEPWRLELEVTESAIIADKDRALHMLTQVKELGVTIAIDDFGTGYSSLETLRAFPFDKIKLDRSFIREVETSRQSKAIIRAILALGRSLEVPVLAEGVETPAQLSLLRSEGCDEAQGYFLGRPGVLRLAEPETPPRVA